MQILQPTKPAVPACDAAQARRAAHLAKLALAAAVHIVDVAPLRRSGVAESGQRVRLGKGLASCRRPVRQAAGMRPSPPALPSGSFAQALPACLGGQPDLLIRGETHVLQAPRGGAVVRPPVRLACTAGESRPVGGWGQRAAGPAQALLEGQAAHQHAEVVPNAARRAQQGSQPPAMPPCPIHTMYRPRESVLAFSLHSQETSPKSQPPPTHLATRS